MRQDVLWGSIEAICACEAFFRDADSRKRILEYTMEIVRGEFLRSEIDRGYSSYRQKEYDFWVKTKTSLTKSCSLLRLALRNMEEAFYDAESSQAGKILIVALKTLSGLLLVRKIRQDVSNTFKQATNSNRFKNLYELAFYDQEGYLVCIAENVKEASIELGIPAGSMKTIISDVFPGRSGEGTRKIRWRKTKLTVYFTE